MASSTRTPGRPAAAPPSTNGARPRLPVPGAGGLGTARRSAPMAVAGVACVLVGALVFLGLYTGMDRRQEVLAVARPVAAGQVIAAQDLRIVRVSAAEGVAPVQASRSSSVVGKTAAVPLVPGTLLVGGQVGPPSALQAGQAIVGLALKAGQAPASLPPGTRVQVVDTLKSANGDAPRPLVVTASAVVAPGGEGAVKPSTNATIVVSLIVPAADAPAVAAAAQDGQISLVVLPAS